MLWCQHHNGIWRSVDNAASWQEVTNVPVSNFGFAVAVHPGRRRHGVVRTGRGRRSAAYRKTARSSSTARATAGRSFETLRAGLPQSNCYDLAYRHGLVVGDDGRTLLMGTTTGGLWASADGGDRWSTVSLNLPPIYAVRFG